MTLNTKYIKSIDTLGSGRQLVVLTNNLHSHRKCALKIQADNLNFLSHIIVVGDFGKEWSEALRELTEQLEQASIKNSLFIAIGECAILLQALCLKNPKIIRTLVFIDPITRSKATWCTNAIEKIEQFLPLGLPFRGNFEGFDGKPFLQRLRCPILVITTKDADAYIKDQAQIISNRSPTSFLMSIDKSINEDSFNLNLQEILNIFQGVPAKCPQKNVK